MVINLAIAETTEEESTNTAAADNSEFFHTCSDGDYDKFKSLLDADPSLIHATTKDGEHARTRIDGTVNITALRRLGRTNLSRVRSAAAPVVTTSGAEKSNG